MLADPGQSPVRHWRWPVPVACPRPFAASFLAAGSREAQRSLFQIGMCCGLVGPAVTAGGVGVCVADACDGGWQAVPVSWITVLGVSPDPAQRSSGPCTRMAPSLLRATGHRHTVHLARESASPIDSNRASDMLSLFPILNERQITRSGQQPSPFRHFF